VTVAEAVDESGSGAGGPGSPDGAEPGRPDGSVRRSRPWRVVDIVGPVVFFGLFLLVWVGFSARLPENRKFLVPTPGQVWREGFADPVIRSEIFNAAWQTTKEAMFGLFLAILIGCGLAILMSQARWIERSVFPWAVALQTIPILALVPLIQVRFGVDWTARVIVCVLIAVFPIITNTLFGLQSADEEHHNLFTLHRAGRPRRLWKLQLPGALPAMFTGFRISAGLAVVGAIVGEYFFRSGKSGIGHLIEKYRARTQFYPRLFAVIAVACGLGVIVFIAFSAVGNLATRKWYEPAQRSRE
jgi:NitT/TauT family transport system permease protein